MSTSNFTPPVRVLREPDAEVTHLSGPVMAGSDDVTDGGTQKRAHPNGTGHIYGEDNPWGPGTTFRGRLFIDDVELT